MVNSRIGAKKYFLPVYTLWAIVTPTIVTFMSAYLEWEQGMQFFSLIPWRRVLSFYALFGLIWPLTIVISPAFFLSVKRETGLTFMEAIGASGFTATKALVGYTLFAIAWIGPLISFGIVLYLHKKEVSEQAKDPKKFGWVDYLAAFV